MFSFISLVETKTNKFAKKADLEYLDWFYKKFWLISHKLFSLKNFFMDIADQGIVYLSHN